MLVNGTNFTVRWSNCYITDELSDLS